MSINYEFKFYSPQPMCDPAKVIAALRGLISHGGQATGYEAGGRWQRLPVSSVLDPALAVSQQGESLVELRFSRAAGPLAVLFQTYLPESKGAQLTLSITDVAFESAPGDNAALLLDLARIVNHHLPAWFGWGDSELVLQYLEPALAFDRVAALAWANIFGPPMLANLDVERLRPAPAHQVIHFKQGLLYVLTPIPTQPISPDLRSRVQAYFPNCALSPE